MKKVFTSAWFNLLLGILLAALTLIAFRHDAGRAVENVMWNAEGRPEPMCFTWFFLTGYILHSLYMTGLSVYYFVRKKWFTPL
ncbi:MAG TPA: hypothetical protein VFU15_07305, partial [Bacteroidia bacterium]|nr:hypothetical protein [Bacteroidia bacterium]